MPRGRPKAQPKIEPTDIEAQLAEKMANRCGIPGCHAKNHLEEAREYIRLVENKKETAI